MIVTIGVANGKPRLRVDPENDLERAVLVAMGPEHGQPRSLVTACDGESLEIHEEAEGSVHPALRAVEAKR